MKYGSVLAGIYATNHDEARLLQEIMQSALKDRAGTKAEPTLARWNNELSNIRRKADANEWVGWE
ncbi:hypothetical protein FA04_14630 [Ensifer adhaerens]|uniref:Uncharacterized protein n=1 Tax=Ensifer adhaerens TaxID=106592 RepID=A0ABY8HCZ6_ENSAD|nr:hypothetical protein [Ensifer adhaerens]ANK73747.1 hypothetical protein FA04_14630 [Ensifer adhaerens]KDP70291.1 hypothetical protein FA04_29070 [Ensifer adhaerens]WFP89833.1 hypothetical protein P4B07_14865 [Ensifer adhaerens]